MKTLCFDTEVISINFASYNHRRVPFGFLLNLPSNLREDSTNVPFT